MDTYDRALADLRSPDTWCRGAAALARLGDVRSLLPLLEAYETRSEIGKGCLLDAMEQLGGEKQAAVLMAAEDAGRRRAGAHLAELFASDDQLAPLLTAVHDADHGVRAQALRSLRLQKQTPAWELAMMTLLDDDLEELRASAIDKLASRDSRAAE